MNFFVKYDIYRNADLDEKVATMKTILDGVAKLTKEFEKKADSSFTKNM